MKKRGKIRETDKNEFKGTILILLTALISGLSIVINKFFVVKTNPLVFTSVRAIIIGLVFLGISLYISKTNKQKFKKVSWKYLVSIGLIGGGLAFWLFFTGLKITTAGRAAFIHKTLPIYAGVFAYIWLKEKITKKHLTAMAVMLLGLVLLESGKIASGIKMGDFLVLGATILWAIENTIAKKAMMKKESNWVVTFSRMFFGSLLLFAIIFLTGKTDQLFALTYQQLLYIAISTGFLFLYVLTWYLGLKHINLSKASTILLLSPVISLILGYLLLKESVLTFQLIGSVLILGGAYLVAKVKSEKRIIEA